MFEDFYPGSFPKKEDFGAIALNIKRFTDGKDVRLLCIDSGGSFIAPALESALADLGINPTKYILHRSKKVIRDGGMGYRPIVGVTANNSTISVTELDIPQAASYNVLLDDLTRYGRNITGGAICALEKFDGQTIVVIYDDILCVAQLYKTGIPFISDVIPPQMRIRRPERLKKVLQRNAQTKYEELNKKGYLDRLFEPPVSAHYSLYNLPAILKGWIDHYHADRILPEQNYQKYMQGFKRLANSAKTWML